MTTKHTPGPWEWVPGEHGYSTLWNPETRQEVITTGGRNEGDYPVTWMGEEMSDADKALIEAAPDLLAVARKMRSALNDAFAAGIEEREGGSARRQGKLQEKIEQFMAECKAAIAKTEVGE